MLIMLALGINLPKSEPFRKSYFEDKSARLLFSDIYLLDEGNWVSSHKIDTILGMSASAFWFKIELFNSQDKPLNKVIEIPYPVLDQVDFFHIVDGQLISNQSKGDLYLFSSREGGGRLFTFFVTLPSQKTSKIFLRVRTSSDMNVPITLFSTEEYRIYEDMRVLIIGGFIGIFLVMIFYNFFLYRYTGDPTYRYYIYFVVSAFFVHIPLVGIGYKYLWPYSTYLEERVLLAFMPLMVAAGAFFISLYFNLQKTNPLMERFCRAIIIIEMVLAGFSLFLPLPIILPINLLSLLVGFSLFVFLYREVKTHEGGTIFFMIGWLTITLSGIIVIFEHFSWIESNVFTQNATFFAMTFDCLALSVAINRKINRMVREQRLVKSALSGKLSQDNCNEDWQSAVHYLIEPSAKEVTMMFIDIVGFSKSSQLLSPESSFTLLKECMHEISEIVHEYGGMIDRSLGDGLFCFFGYKVQGDHQKTHVEQAFEAAKKIQYQSVMKSVTGLIEAVFPMRIGINTDTVFIGNIGSEGKVDFTMIGNGVILASRLETACNPFKIMVSEKTMSILKQTRDLRESGFNPIQIRIKHQEQLTGAFEYNVFHDDNRMLHKAEMAYWKFLKQESLAERSVVSVDSGLVLVWKSDTFVITDFSVGGFGVLGDLFLGRTVEIEVNLDSTDGVVGKKLESKNLHLFKVEVRWGQRYGKRFEQGMRITSLNKSQLVHIYEVIDEYLKKKTLLKSS